VSAFPIAVEEGAPRPSLWASCSRAGYLAVRLCARACTQYYTLPL
jgi:hypothetical protein